MYSNRRISIFLAFLLLGLMTFLTPLLWGPPGSDAGIFTWVAHVVLQGGLPYVDAFDNKGPALFYIYAFVLWLGGGEWFAVRMLDFVLAYGCIAITVIWLRSIGGPSTGWIGGLLLLLFLHFDFWTLGQPDLWAAEAAIVMLWLIECSRRTATCLLAGVLAGLMVVLKPVYIPFAAVVFLLVLFPQGLRSFAFRACLAFACGALLCPLAVLSIYALHGQLYALWEVNILFALKSYRGLGNNPAFYHILMPGILQLPRGDMGYQMIGIGMITLQFVMLAGLYRLMRDGYKRLAIRLLVAWGCAFFIASWQGKYFFYHYCLLLFVAVIPAAYWLSRPLPVGGLRERLALYGRGMVVMLLATQSLFFLSPAFEGWKVRLGLKPNSEWLAESFVHGNYEFARVKEAASYINAHTNADDLIYVWGTEAYLYPLAQRAAPTRFGYNHAFVMSKEPLRSQFVTELLADLTINQPALVIIQKTDENDLTRRSIESLSDFPSIEQLFRQNYTQLWENKSFLLLKRNMDPFKPEPLRTPVVIP